MRMSVVNFGEGRSVTPFFKYVLIVMVIVVGIFIFINIKIRPFVVSVAKGYAANVASNTLNDIIDAELKKDDYNFVKLVYDDMGKIAAVSMNGTDVNRFMTKITIGLKEKIADMDEVEAKIPLGNFFSYPFLSGLGPKIGVKFVVLANSSITATESFVAEGINQTLYTVNLDVDIKVGIYIPSMHSSVETKNIIPIAQTLIVGNVPDNYTNVEGMEGTVQDTVLDIE